MPIHISFPGSTVLAPATTTWTVHELRAYIKDARGIGEEHLQLVHAAKDLRHRCGSSSLVECGLRPGDTVHATFTLVGGGKKNTKGGKKYKKSGKTNETRELVFKEDGQEYAQVSALLGSSRLRVQCADGVSRLCTIRGKLVRRAWVSLRDIILVSLRDFEEGKCDMIHKFSSDEARNLQLYKELPAAFQLQVDNSAADGEGEDDGIVFGFDAEDEEIDIDAL